MGLLCYSLAKGFVILVELTLGVVAAWPIGGTLVFAKAGHEATFFARRVIVLRPAGVFDSLAVIVED